MPVNDLFATKAIEYVAVIIFLLAFVVFVRLLPRSAPEAALAPVLHRPHTRWFRVPNGVLFHPGHGWATVERDGVLKVGLDDFAQRLLGRPSDVKLPRVGSTVRQGENGWSLGVEERSIDMLSPVDGQVVEVNRDVLEDPELVNEDPYGRGWLMRVRTKRPRAMLTGLLSGSLAASWMEGVENDLLERMVGPSGVMPDGGMPVEGIALHLLPDDWEVAARELLLTN